MATEQAYHSNTWHKSSEGNATDDRYHILLLITDFYSLTLSLSPTATHKVQYFILQTLVWVADKRIRHIPVIDERGMMGMVSIGDVVRAVVSEHREELDRLNAFIQGGY